MAIKVNLAVLISVAAWMCTFGSGDSLSPLSQNELSNLVADNCGATTNLKFSACGHDANLCSGQANKLTVGGANVTIPGTGVTLPFTFTPWEWELGCKAGAVGDSGCQKRQHEEATGADGNRVNDSFPDCGGIYTKPACQDRVIVIPVASGWDLSYPCIKDGKPAICTTPLTNPVSISVPHGCEDKPVNATPLIDCENAYNKMKACTHSG